MYKGQISSILNPIVVEARKMIDAGLDIVEVKQYIAVELNKHTRVDTSDLTRMIGEVSRAQTSFKLLTYLYNARLKYEGCGII